MTLAEVALVVRAFQRGMEAFADELDRLVDLSAGVESPRMASPEPRADERANALRFLSRHQLQELLEQYDPEFVVEGKPDRDLRFRLAQITRPIDGPIEDAITNLSSGFMPPGVATDEESTLVGEQLQLWFDRHMHANEERIRGFYRTKGCDGRCSRPGGACPQAKVCGEELMS